jgi:O-antigen/teichoic acid export membrane protein
VETHQVRLRYSGFVVFTTQILSLITGLVFTLLLTRNMTTDQFNVWTNIFDYTGYFLLFNPVIPFWATRFVARGKEGAVKTSVSAQLTIALVSTVIYFPVIVLISNAIGTSSYLPIYLIAGFYILTFYSITIFESILQCVKPQFVGYGLMIEEIVKVTIALVLILGFKQLFLGAILGLVVSCVVQVFFYIYILRGYLKQKVHWGYLKEWIKGSPAIVYNAVGGQLLSFVFILLFLYGGSGARAYYQAALTFTVIISYANSLAFALYPKLLAKSCNDEQIGVSFRTVMMLAIPFAAITMVMSMSFLTILKLDYSAAWPVLIALTVDTLIVMVTAFYSNCVMGVEGFDAEGKIAFRKLVRSKIFKVFTIPYIQAAVAVPLAYFVLTGLPGADSVQATVEVVVILLAVHVSTLLGLYYFMRRSIKISVAWKSIAKYILSALLMGIVLYLLPSTSTLLYTIAKAVGGFALYIGVLLLIDHQARELVGLVWEEIRGTLEQLTSKNGFKDENADLTTEN